MNLALLVLHNRVMLVMSTWSMTVRRTLSSLTSYSFMMVPYCVIIVGW